MAEFLFILVWTACAALVSAQEGEGEGKGEAKQVDHALVMAHAITASLAWVVFFPGGAIAIRLIRSSNAVWLHAGIQGGTLLLLLAGVLTGVHLAEETNTLDSYHPILGLILFALVIAQAAGGILQHILFRKHARRTIISHLHIWLGRILITLGMINGGLGFLINDDSSRGERIAYGVIAAIFWLAFVTVSAWSAHKEASRIPPPKSG